MAAALSVESNDHDEVARTLHFLNECIFLRRGKELDAKTQALSDLKRRVEKGEFSDAGALTDAGKAAISEVCALRRYRIDPREPDSQKAWGEFLKGNWMPATYIPYCDGYQIPRAQWPQALKFFRENPELKSELLRTYAWSGSKNLETLEFYKMLFPDNPIVEVGQDKRILDSLQISGLRHVNTPKDVRLYLKILDPRYEEAATDRECISRLNHFVLAALAGDISEYEGSLYYLLRENKYMIGALKLIGQADPSVLCQFVKSLFDLDSCITLLGDNPETLELLAPLTQKCVNSFPGAEAYAEHFAQIPSAMEWLRGHVQTSLMAELTADSCRQYVNIFKNDPIALKWLYDKNCTRFVSKEYVSKEVLARVMALPESPGPWFGQRCRSSVPASKDFEC